MVQHVIAPAVDHARLQDRVIEAAAADDLLGRPLGLVVRRTAVGSRPQEAEQDDLRNARAARSLDDMARALDVDTAIGLRAELAIDAGAVRDGVASLEGRRESVGIGQIGRNETSAAEGGAPTRRAYRRRGR
jgi:hypothetical protein